MKAIIFIFFTFLAIPCISFCQPSIFKLKAFDPCNGITQIDSLDYYWLVDEDSTVFERDFKRNEHFIRLVQTGTYTLYSMISPCSEAREFNNRKMEIGPGENELTYRKDSIIEELINMHGPVIYMCCGQPCQGIASDFYSDGKIRITGRFKDGFPLDTILKFWRNGFLSSQIINGTNKKIYCNYDSLGRIDEKRIYTKNVKVINYYKSGKKKSDRIYKQKVKKYLEFSKSGSLLVKQQKKRRLEYYESGQLKSKIKKRRIYLIENFCWDKLIFKPQYCYDWADYRFKILHYREDGSIENKVVLDMYAIDTGLFPYRLTDGDWIKKLFYYNSDGHKQVIFKNEDAGIHDYNFSWSDIIISD